MVGQVVGAEIASSERRDALRRSGLLRADTFHRLDRLTTLASTLTGAPVALISMVDDHRQFFTAQHGLAEPWATRRETPLSHSVCRTVVESGEPLSLPSLAADETFADHPARADLDIEAYCGVPIHGPEGHVLGSFCVIDHEDRQWDADTVEVLHQLSALVTDAVATSRDYTKLVIDLQRRLLPEELPTLPSGIIESRYRPVPETEHIGGDFFDALVRGDGALVLILGDVIGHGVTSTQAAAQLRAAARATVSGPVGSPAATIGWIAEACADLPGCECAALTVVEITPDGSQARWSRAGAMPPIVLHRGAATVRETGAGPPLGVGPPVADPLSTVDLAPGDALMVFTDGIIERRGESADVGLQRLADAARRHDQLDDLIDAAMPSVHQVDDIAVLRWRRTS